MGQPLPLTGDILPIAGGLMIGTAITIMYLMLRGPQLTRSRVDGGRSSRWAVLLGFVLGAPLGAYVVSQFVDSRGHGPPENVLLGLVAGACLTYFLARRPMRQ